MKRMLFVTWVVLAITFGVLTIPLTLAAIWLNDERFGETAGLTGCLAVLFTMILGIGYEETPSRSLPRSERKALRMEEARVRRDAAIRALEQELGQ